MIQSLRKVLLLHHLHQLRNKRKDLIRNNRWNLTLKSQIKKMDKRMQATLRVKRQQERRHKKKRKEKKESSRKSLSWLSKTRVGNWSKLSQQRSAH